MVKQSAEVVRTWFAQRGGRMYHFGASIIFKHYGYPSLIRLQISTNYNWYAKHAFDDYICSDHKAIHDHDSG